MVTFGGTDARRVGKKGKIGDGILIFLPISLPVCLFLSTFAPAKIKECLVTSFKTKQEV